MRAARFVRRTAILLLPAFLALAGYEALLWMLGETWTTSRVVHAAADAHCAGRELLYGREILSDDMQLYKARELDARRPAVVALGSSTSMQHRAKAFGPYRDDFYNLGGMIQRIEDLPTAASLLARTRRVRLVVLGIDLWWFNANWESGRKPLSEELADGESALSWRAHHYAARILLERYWRSGDTLLSRALQRRSRIDGARAVGMGARKGSGFRASDGSHQYGYYIRRSLEGIRPAKDAGIVKRVHRGRRRFEGGHEVDPERLVDLKTFLDECREAGIEVVGVVGPLSSGTRGALARSKRHRGLVEDYRRTIRAMFDAADMPRVDAFDPSALGLDDRYMIDGLHGSETFMAHVVAAALDDPRVRRTLPGWTPADIDRLLRDPRTTPAELAPWEDERGSPRAGARARPPDRSELDRTQP